MNARLEYSTWDKPRLNRYGDHTSGALAQFDPKPEAAEKKLRKTASFGSQAVQHGIRCVVSHKGTVRDYTTRPNDQSARLLIGFTRQRDRLASFACAMAPQTALVLP